MSVVVSGSKFELVPNFSFAEYLDFPTCSKTEIVVFRKANAKASSAGLVVAKPRYSREKN